MIELLIALLIGGLVAGSVFQVLAGQGRLVETLSAREEVQQNTRAALELIGSELRTLPGGDALVRAASDSITMRVPRIWGVVCAVGGPTSLDVVFPTAPGTSYSLNLGTGIVANLGVPSAPEWSDAVALLEVGGASNTCAAEPLATGAERRTLTLASPPRKADLTPDAGQALYLYDLVTYRTGRSPGLPGLWIQRRIGDGPGSTNQPFAGPVTDEGPGLRFGYFGGAATASLAMPIGDAATRAAVERVSVIVESVSRLAMAGERLSKADTITVPLRNRP